MSRSIILHCSGTLVGWINPNLKFHMDIALTQKGGQTDTMAVKPQ